MVDPREPRRLALILAALALAACATTDRRPPIATLTTDTPCYVRARTFVGFVPVDCADAQVVRP